MLAATILTIPLLTGDVSAPTTTAAVGCVGAGGQVEIALATIRHVESGDNYQAHATGSTASGAYQFLDTTWSNYGGYPNAASAPPAVQDARARAWVEQILATNLGDVNAIPPTWYIGHVPAIGSPEWDRVPYPAANVLTPRQYQTRWMTTYQQLAAALPQSPPPTTATTVVGGGATTSKTANGTGKACAGAVLDGYALPLDSVVLDRNPAGILAAHHDYPAWDYPIPAGTPVYAMHAGIVTFTSNYSGNCYANRNACIDLCGIGLSIRDTDGVDWIYCHATRLDVALGDTVTTGQQIMTSGNTGHSSGPHLHLGIRTNGTNHCPQPLLDTLHTTGRAIAPSQLPVKGCTT